MTACPHCSGTGEVQADGDPTAYCDAWVIVAHERFGCLRHVGHDGYHEAFCGVPQCSGCGGWEEHADGCPLVGDEVPDGSPCFDVRWNDGDESPRFVEYRPLFPRREAPDA